MRRGMLLGAVAAAIAVGSVATVWLGAQTPAQAPTPTFRMPRTADGKPNFTGIWEGMNTANWNIEPHPAKAGPIVALGAAFAVQPGPGVVEGGPIPYRPEMLAKRKENGDNYLT